VVFNLPVSEETLLPGMVKHERFEQKFPMRGETRCSIPASEREVLLTVLIIGYGQYLLFG
jgi:hypothetical protein